MISVKKIGNVKGKYVLVRTGFDVPLTAEDRDTNEKHLKSMQEQSVRTDREETHD